MQVLNLLNSKESSFQKFWDDQCLNSGSHFSNNFLLQYRSPDNVKNEATPTKSSDESQGKSSNVIKIFNPHYNKNQTSKEEDARSNPNGPHSLDNRILEYTNVQNGEELQYLSNENEPLNDNVEVDQELSQSEVVSCSQQEIEEGQVDDKRKSYLDIHQPFSDVDPLQIDNNLKDNEGIYNDDNPFQAQTIKENLGIITLQQNHSQATSGNSQVVKISISQDQSEESLKKRGYQEAFTSIDNNIEQNKQSQNLNEQSSQDENKHSISTTIRLNIGNPLPTMHVSKQHEVAQPESKRQKIFDQQIDTSQQIIKTAEQRYQEIFNKAISEGLYYNRQLTQIRHQNREHFSVEKLKRVQERNQLHQNHNSFLHQNYQPGLAFFNYLNTMSANHSYTSKSNNYNTQSQNMRQYSHKNQGGFVVPQTPQTQTNQSQIQRSMQTFNHFFQSSNRLNQPNNQVNPNQRVPFGIQTQNKPQISAFSDINKLNDPVQEKEMDQSPSKKDVNEQFQEKNDINQTLSIEQQQNIVQTNSNGSNDYFMCITCHRGPPYTRKYAKNQCQTCYKKTKKYQRDPDDYYGMYPGMASQGFQQPFPPHHYEGSQNMNSVHSYRQLLRSSSGQGMMSKDQITGHNSSLSEEHEVQQEMAE